MVRKGWCRRQYGALRGCGESEENVKKCTTLVHGGFRWRHEIGSRVGDAEVAVEAKAEAEAKRVSKVTLPFAGVIAGEAAGRNFENNLSTIDTADTVPLMAPVWC
jgi:hypothetical protein